MPTDDYVYMPIVLRIRMPFNTAAPKAREGSSAEQRLRNKALPRPWTVLITGGYSKHAKLEPRDILEIAQTADARALERGGSLLVSTCPPTPSAANSVLHRTLTAPGELYEFATARGCKNPLGAYLKLAGELIVTGNSASMIAECWRSGRPLWVIPMRKTARRRAR